MMKATTLVCMIVCLATLVSAGHGYGPDDCGVDYYIGFGIPVANQSRVSSQLIKINADTGAIATLGSRVTTQNDQYCNNAVGYLDNRLRAWVLSLTALTTMDKTGRVIATNPYTNVAIPLKIHNSFYDKYAEVFQVVITKDQRAGNSYQFATINTNGRVTLGANITLAVDVCIAGYDRQRDLFYVSVNSQSIAAIKRSSGQVQATYAFTRPLEFATNILVAADGTTYISSVDRTGKARVYHCTTNTYTGVIACNIDLTQPGSFTTLFSYSALIDDNKYYTFNWNIKGTSRIYGYNTNSGRVVSDVALTNLKGQYPFGIYNMIAVEN